MQNVLLFSERVVARIRQAIVRAEQNVSIQIVRMNAQRFIGNRDGWRDLTAVTVRRRQYIRCPGRIDTRVFYRRFDVFYGAIMLAAVVQYIGIYRSGHGAIDAA